ncbi:hypothetical protein ACIG5E_16890 [Kitasatospora sp. NPDC053057]|uniref:hypothetical protein n=1 Tax=Kitasatospora sp. NPDC053057 TaxID=3364062 RepID=UPI0037CACB3B
MTEPADTTLLTYALTTTPAVLVRATPGHPRQGRLEITVSRNPQARGDASCRSITVEVPSGGHPQALTDRPERIDTAYSAPHGRSWHIHKNTATHPDRTVITCTPENPRREAVFDETATLTLILERIALTGPPGTVSLRITDDTAGGSQAHARRSTELSVAVQQDPADAS